MIAARFEPFRIIDPKSQAELRAFKERLEGSELALDTGGLKMASLGIALSLKNLVYPTTSLGSLSYNAHLVNGFGNFRFKGITGLSALSSFSKVKDGRYSMPQDGKGNCADYHPWQTFAYAAMAGIKPEQDVNPLGISLRDLALNSRDLNLAEGIVGSQAGHLLFAAAFITPDADLIIKSNRTKLTLREIVRLALIAHADSQHCVCSGFHLTEGLCAVGSKIDKMDEIKLEAAELLKRQLDVLAKTLALGAEVSIMDQIAYSLYMDMNHMKLSNRINIIAHILELGGFAQILGYELDRTQINLLKYSANEIVNNICAILGLPLNLCLTYLCHLRRAIELLVEIEEAKNLGLPLSSIEISKYVVDFDRLD